MRDDGAGCFLALLLGVACFFGGFAMCQESWMRWRRNDLIERGEAHYDTKTGAWVLHKKENVASGH